MPKAETSTMQTQIRDLGKKLGFISVMEKPLHEKNTYAPIYDVVWFLDMTKHFKLDELDELFKNNKGLLKRLKMLPFAGFEIEGASTSSKNQIGNFANLYGGQFLYNFVIVNNDAANGEADTYRRGVKIKHYFADNSGDKNVFFFDNVHLQKSIARLKCYDFDIIPSTVALGERKTFGGETSSKVLYEKTKKSIEKTRLTICQNYMPCIYKIKFEMLKEAVGTGSEYSDFYLRQSYHKDPSKVKITKATKPSDIFYIPKIDVMLGFNAPKGFTAWLTALADVMGSDYAHFPIFYALKKRLIQELFIPLIGIEYEGSINKHLNGGVYNMSKNSYVGLLVTKEPAESHVDYFQEELGVKNVTSYCVEG